MKSLKTSLIFRITRGGLSLITISLLLSACGGGQKSGIVFSEITPTTVAPTPGTGYIPRPKYQPGELVNYVAQTGDTLPALAAHFNTNEQEIRQVNPEIPVTATTLPAGFPMKIPIYYLPLWGSPYQIMPDNLFINGPSQVGFDPIEFVNSQPGWFKDYQDNAGGDYQRGGELIIHIAQNFSISPKLLLAIIEYQTGALSEKQMPDFYTTPYPLGFDDSLHKGLYQQMLWAVNVLNNGYYGWRAGTLTAFEQKDKTLEHPDPWQNAASVALHYYFSQTMTKNVYDQAVSDQGFILTYQRLFGKPWEQASAHIPGSLAQPPFLFPFEPERLWALTGGPHTGWGEGQPFAAIDFAPPSTVSGCAPSEEWVTAVANGVVARSEGAVLMLDLDGDGDERTGWVVFYLHLSGVGLPPTGRRLQAGDRIGHPSCEGGNATGTHVHMVRKYNGEWILAGGLPAFNLEGWSVRNGSQPYEGTLVKNSGVIRACVCSDANSQIKSDRPPLLQPLSP